MRNSIKAALAAVAGGGLLLGGAGSLAYWDDAEDVPTDTVTSGQLDLGAPVCEGWKLDDGSAFTAATDTIVPGDSLTQICEFPLTVTGDHLEAEFTAEAPSITASALSDELTYTAAYEVDQDQTDDGVAEVAVTPETPASGTADITVADDGAWLRSTLTVDFAFGGSVDNTSNGGIAAVLDAFTVTATQTDSHP